MSQFAEIHSVQVVLFVNHDPYESADKVFYHLVGSEPDQLQRLKPPASPFPVSIASATVRGSDIRVQYSPGRVDFLLNPVANESTLVAPKLPGEESIWEFTQSVKRTTSAIGNASRQSIVVKAARQVAAADLALSFSGLLDTNADFTDCTDLSFSFNRVASVEGIKVNRLLRWASENVQFHQVLGNNFQLATTLASAHYLSYFLDINTVIDGQIRTPDQQGLVFDVLLSVMQECLGYSSIKDVK